MLVAGRLCNKVVEFMFMVSSECLDQLREWCGGLNCGDVWQPLQI